MQELITEEVAKAIPALCAQEEAEDPTVHLHLFGCVSGWDWYITEYDPATGEAFGRAAGSALPSQHNTLDDVVRDRRTASC